MALFGKKNEDNSSENIEDLDAKIMAAIEETDLEEEQRKADRKQAELDRVSKQTAERESQFQNIDDAKPKKAARRFFIMPESKEILESSIKVSGKVFGEVRVGDKVFIYRTNGQVVMSSVLSLESDAEDQVVPEEGEAKAARNAVIKMELGFNFANAGFEPENIINDFSIISNVVPVPNTRKTVENPAILGLTLYYNQYSKDKEFNKVLVNHLVNASFVLPVHATGRNGANGKPAMQLLTLSDTSEEGRRMLPIFTDVLALSGWKNIFNDENKPQVAILTFQEIVNITLKDEIDFVINSSGPVAVRIPFDFISKVVSSESYKARFGEDGKKRQKYRKDTVNDGSKIAVGAPPQTAEVQAIRQALKGYCATVPSIMTAGLLCKLKKGEKPGYLCIVDCPKEQARDIFIGINDVVKPFLNKIKKIEFSRYAETVFADQYFASEPFDYVKNPNASEE